MPGILARKVGMTRVFQTDGNDVPVTVLRCTPSTVAQIKTVEKDGYNAIVLGFEPLVKPKKTKKYRVLKEFHAEPGAGFKVGDQVSVEALKDAKEVIISGISKGKGFAGFIKRHHFHSGPGSHGSHFKREPGSIGARSKPGRIHKGKRMAGHMGFERTTIKHIPLVEVLPEKNLLLVKGPVPGPNGGLVIVQFS